MKKEIKIAGAGISGLTAAIILARNGYKVDVYEVGSHPGGRFIGDWQHLENWTSPKDVLDYLKILGLNIDFFAKPCFQISIYTSSSKEIKLESVKPIFYSVRRGTPTESIDNGLFKTAKELGVEVHFNTSAENKTVDIVATGPKVADGYVVGFNFISSESDKISVFLDKKVSGLYFYLTIIDGKGTLAVYNKKPIKEKLVHLQNKVGKLLNIKIENPQFFTAKGNFSLRRPKEKNGVLFVGEAAGFQDVLAGFGMMYAIRSGCLAARSIIEGKDYGILCRKELLPLEKISCVNRVFWELASKFIFYLLKWRSRDRKIDTQRILNKIYNKSVLYGLLFPIFYRVYIFIKIIKKNGE